MGEPGSDASPEQYSQQPHQQQSQTLKPTQGVSTREAQDGKLGERVVEPGGVDQQLLLVCHSKDEAEREGEQQPGGGTVGGQVPIFLRR